MTQILIIESNTPDMAANAHANGMQAQSELFYDIFRPLGPHAPLRTPDTNTPYLKKDFQGVIFTGSGVAECG